MKKHCATVLLLIAFFLVSIHFAEAQHAAIRADALMIPEGAMFSQNRGRIFEIATRKRSPPSREGSSLTSWRSAFLWSQHCGDMSSISELRR